MDITNRSISYTRPDISVSRKIIIFLILFSFLNTIIFPAVFYPKNHYKKNSLKGEFSIYSITEYDSPTKYSGETYLESNDATPDEVATNYILQLIEDTDDLIDHLHSTTVFAYYRYIQEIHIFTDNLVFYSFYNCSTPPPERCIA